MKYGIYIGAKPKAIRELHSAIATILNSGAEQKTLRVALRSLESLSVNNTTITGCQLGGISDNERAGI